MGYRGVDAWRNFQKAIDKAIVVMMNLGMDLTTTVVESNERSTGARGATMSTAHPDRSNLFDSMTRTDDNGNTY